MNCKFNPKKLDIIYSHQSLIKGLEERRPDLVIYGYERAGTYASIQLFAAIKSGYSSLEELKLLRNQIRKYLKYTLLGTYPNRIKLFSLLLSCPGTLVLTTLLNMIRRG